MADDPKPKTGDADDARAGDPDRDAILARRKRFVALALSGLASGAACKPAPEPCLSVIAPEPPDRPPEEAADSDGDEAPLPIAEEPGAPLESPPAGDPETPEASGGDEVEPTKPEPPPRPCLKVAAPPKKKKARKDKIEVAPKACLLVADFDD